MQKLGELILYVAKKSQDDTTFGATKLNKILFAVDFMAYGAFGKPLTEAHYIRLQHGPVPKELPQVRDELIAEKRAAIQLNEHFGKEQKRIVALDTPDMSIFTDREKRLIDDVIIELKSLNATQLSDWTHGLTPWLVASDKEELPFETVFVLQNKPISKAGVAWGEKVLRETRGD